MNNRKYLRLTVFLLLVWIFLFNCNLLQSTDSTSPEANINMTTSPSQIPHKRMIGFDDRIEVEVDKVEIECVPPADMEKPSLSDGHMFVCIHLTVIHIDNVHLIDVFGYEDQKTYLQDAEGHRYDILIGQVRGVELTDPSDFSSPAEFVEGATGVFIFEIPTQNRPTTLTLIYSYKLSWQDTSSKKGQIDIEL